MEYDYFELPPVIRIPDPEAPWETKEVLNPFVTELDEIGSFEQYCMGHFGYDWIEGLKCVISEKRIPIGKTSFVVPDIECCRVSSAYIQRIDFSRIDRTHICADAIVVADIEVGGHRGEEYVRDTLTQWYRLSHIILATPYGYKIDAIGAKIYDRKHSSQYLPLDQYLIPVLNADCLEDAADNFLMQYYPELFMSAIPTDAELLAERMGLTVMEMPLISKGLYGQTVFYDTTVETEDGPVRVKGGTIILNTSVDYSTAQRSKIIIHECYHYYAHDLFIWGQSLYKDDVACFDCPITLGAYPTGSKSPIFWAEWQAQQITPRIQMHRLTVNVLLEEINGRLAAGYTPIAATRYMETTAEFVVRVVAEYFHTSRRNSKNRLISLGYHAAKGVDNYVDGRFIPSFDYSEGVLGKNQTFLIGLKDAAGEYARNPEFRKLIESGRYIYIEGRFCVNDPKYVRLGNRGAFITAYGRQHTEECCLRFDIRYKDRQYIYEWGKFHWEKDEGSTLCHMCTAEPGLVDTKALTREALWSMEITKAIAGMEFGDALEYVMSAKKITIEQLEETSLISGRTIRRLRKVEDGNVKKEHILALAIGMHLPPLVSMELINIAGLRLTHSFKDSIYATILYSMYQLDIFTVNSYLESLEMPPVSKMAT